MWLSCFVQTKKKPLTMSGLVVDINGFRTADLPHVKRMLFQLS